MTETHEVMLHANFGSSKLNGFWQEDFERFKKLSFVTMAILSRNSEEDYGRNISVKFHQNPISSFREDDV